VPATRTRPSRWVRLPRRKQPFPKSQPFPTYLYQNGNALSHRDGPTYRSSQCNPDSHGYPYQRHPQFSTTGDSAAFVSDVTFRMELFSIREIRLQKPGDSGTMARPPGPQVTRWSIYAGGLMGSVQAVQLPAEVPSGKTVDLSVSFTAPAAAGQYTVCGCSRTAPAKFFGIGPNANQPRSTCSSTFSSSTGGTSIPTTTPGTTTPGSMTADGGTLSVDQTSYSGSCPVTLKPVRIHHLFRNWHVGLYLGSRFQHARIHITLPGAHQKPMPLEAATHSHSYFLNISSSVSGWVRLYISAPNILRSAQIDFTVTLQMIAGNGIMTDWKNFFHPDYPPLQS